MRIPGRCERMQESHFSFRRSALRTALDVVYRIELGGTGVLALMSKSGPDLASHTPDDSSEPHEETEEEQIKRESADTVALDSGRVDAERRHRHP
jgi:hypothetical protein